MHYSFAPMEGITGYVFRQAHHEVFPEMDEYYIPFATPNMHHSFSPKEAKDVAPENNRGMHAVPQLMANNPDYFLKACEELYELGYREVNLNTGCPSPTVVTKGKGAGMLRDTIALDAFFHQVFSRWNLDMAVSVKTRVGIEQEEEFADIAEVFNTYPISKIIVHPRTQKDQYRCPVRPHMFAEAVRLLHCPLIYNGDLHSPGDCRAIEQAYPQLEGLMLGRGLLENPGLITQLKTGRPVGNAEIRRFHDSFYERYVDFAWGDKQLLAKMKELWIFLSVSFPGSEKLVKQIKKCNRAQEYDGLVDRLFSTCQFAPKA